MISGLTSYVSMKDCGVPWLRQVPEHWELKRTKFLFDPVDIRSESGAEELLTVSSNFGIVPRRSTKVTMFKAESYAGHKLCWPGDLVINSLWAWSRGLGVSQHHGIVSTAYGVYRTKDDGVLDPQFVHEFVRSKPFHWELRVRSKGVWTSRLQLTDESFLDAPFLVPPLPEQATIVRFLDYADRRIRRYIRIKQKLIKLLEEQKQAIIHQAVTRGLGPSVRLKPSGVEWLGDVPEHWDVIPLKRAFSRMDYGISDSGSDSGTIPVLTMGHIRNGVVTVPELGGVDCVEPGLVLEDKDLLFNRTNSAELVAKVGMFRSGSRPVTFASYLVRMRSLAANSPEFLNLVLNAPAFLGAARREAIPSLHQSNLNPTRYGRLSIPLPPSQEQKDIFDAVLDQTAGSNDAAASARREIELLQEYRTRLVADVVTGKLDVREAVAKLPYEPETVDEGESDSEPEDVLEDDLDTVMEEAES